MAEPQLSLLAFRVVRPGLDEAATNDLNRRVMEAVNARRRVYITNTIARGRFLIRICVLSFRTHMDRMEMAVEDTARGDRGAGLGVSSGPGCR